MIRTVKLVLAVLCVASLTGCIIPKGYIDPSFRTATYKDVAPAPAPVPAKVDVAFLSNGHVNKRAQDIVDRKVSRVLDSTKVFAKDSAAPSTLSIQIQNIADTGTAFAKGFGTGLTFGLVGSHVIDKYEMVVTYKPGATTGFDHTYYHALHSTIGIKSAPEGMQPVPLADAFDQIVEDMMLHFLVDFQKWQKEPAPTVAAKVASP